MEAAHEAPPDSYLLEGVPTVRVTKSSVVHDKDDLVLHTCKVSTLMQRVGPRVAPAETGEENFGGSIIIGRHASFVASLSWRPKDGRGM